MRQDRRKGFIPYSCCMLCGNVSLKNKTIPIVKIPNDQIYNIAFSIGRTTTFEEIWGGRNALFSPSGIPKSEHDFGIRYTWGILTLI